MTESENIINQLYTSIATGDVAKMEGCYAKKVHFHDPIFGTLMNHEVTNMWKMLIEKSNGNLKINYNIVESNPQRALAEWTASYNFGKKQRKVINHITSEFYFKDGLIIRQIDDFNIWNWSKQALGWPGILLGWTGYLHRKIHKQAVNSLKKFNYKESITTK